MLNSIHNKPLNLLHFYRLFCFAFLPVNIKLECTFCLMYFLFVFFYYIFLFVSISFYIVWNSIVSCPSIWPICKLGPFWLYGFLLSTVNKSFIYSKSSQLIGSHLIYMGHLCKKPKYHSLSFWNRLGVEEKRFFFDNPKMEIVSWYMEVNQMEQRLASHWCVSPKLETLLCKQWLPFFLSFSSMAWLLKSFPNFMMTTMSRL